ncbi:MAG: radical SAM/SPASM domain-containing protein [bacterium]
MFNRIYLEITNACNMSCSFCIKNTRKTQVMNIDNFKTIINKIKDHTSNIYLHVLGEPTSHPNIIEFLDILKQNNLSANITTNGTLLNDKLITSSLRKISISLHSIEKGSINDNKEYIDKIYDFVSKASSKGIICELRLWNINAFDNYNKQIVQPLLDKLNIDTSLIEKGYKIKENLYIGLAQRFQWPDLNNDLTNKDVYCHGLKRQLSILVDGTVVPCCLDSKGVMNLGNINNSSLQEILDTNRCKEIINGFNNRKPSEELCKRCSYATRF